MLAFSDLAEAIKDCPRGCGHMGPPADPECALDTLSGPRRGPGRRRAATAGRAAGELTTTSRETPRERARLYTDTPCHDGILRTLARS